MIMASYLIPQVSRGTLAGAGGCLSFPKFNAQVYNDYQKMNSG